MPNKEVHKQFVKLIKKETGQTGESQWRDRNRRVRFGLLSILMVICFFSFLAYGFFFALEKSYSFNIVTTSLFDLVENSQNVGAKTGKKDKKNLEISRFRGFLVEISGIEPLTS